MKILLYSLCVGIFCFSSNAYGDISSDLNSFFNSIGQQAISKNNEVTNDQSAGFYTGGEFFPHSEAHAPQIMKVNTPGLSSGCGGIDLFKGGFSFIKADQFVQFAKSIMSSAGGYALNLALETAVPEIAHDLQYMQRVAQSANNSNLGSCEMGEDLVGGVWPKVRASQQQICEDIGLQNNKFADWSAARLGCSGSGADYDENLKAAEVSN